MHESESEVAQSGPTLRNPMDCSLPGSSVYGIFQARVLEWGAIAFSEVLSNFYLLNEHTHTHTHRPEVPPNSFKIQFQSIPSLLELEEI